MKTLKDISIDGKRVMVRAGLDVPFDSKKDLLDPSRVSDDVRIVDILPTLQYLIERKAKIVIAAGWAGRPKGVDPDYSMAPVAKRLEQLLSERGLLRNAVLLAPDCFIDHKPKSVFQNRDEVKRIVGSLKEGQVVVLENVRYDPEANSNDQKLSAFYASLADVYVNENETQNHREEATIVSTPLLVAQAGGEVVFGLKYVDVLAKIGDLRNILQSSSRGAFVFGLCGKKIESDPGIVSKITVAYDLMDVMRKGDTLVVGGGVAYTFLLAQHYWERMDRYAESCLSIVNEYDKKILALASVEDKKKAEDLTTDLQKKKSEDLKRLLAITDDDIKSIIGGSYIRWGQEGEQIVFAYKVLRKAKQKGISVVTLLDHIITNLLPDKFGNLPKGAEIKVFDKIEGIPTGWLGVAEGPRTLQEKARIIEQASIFLQSGPFSIEDSRVEEISKTDARIFAAVKNCTQKGGITIGAGGDTVARIHKYHAQDCFSIITDAGGATLELIQSGTSKGKEAVEKAQRIRSESNER